MIEHAVYRTCCVLSAGTCLIPRSHLRCVFLKEASHETIGRKSAPNTSPIRDNNFLFGECILRGLCGAGEPRPNSRRETLSPRIGGRPSAEGCLCGFVSISFAFRQLQEGVRGF